MARRNKGVRPVLLGPDDKYGARPTKGYTTYVWYAEWFDRGRRRLRSLDCRYGEPFQEKLDTVRAEVSLRASGTEKSMPDANLGMLLQAYFLARGPEVVGKRALMYRVKYLTRFFGKMNVSELTDLECQNYARTRPSDGTARVELQTMAAAIRLAIESGTLTRRKVSVWCPPEPEGRERVLSRSEIAAMIRHWRKRKLTRHHAIATMIAYRTGARIGSVLSLGFEPSKQGGHFDLSLGTVKLNPTGRRVTKKRKPTVPIPRQLLPILRAMKRNGKTHPCGRASLPPVTAQNFSAVWRTTSDSLDIYGSVAHSLRHSRITHLLVAGQPPTLVAEFVGLDLVTLLKKYKHIIPGHLRSVADS